MPMHWTPRRASPRSVVVCVLTAILLVLVGSLAAPARATTTAERAVHAMINEARANSGLGPLTLSDRLSRIAHSHSKQMANSGTLFHTCLCGIGGRRLGENVGYGANRVAVQGQLMASPPHRANILGKFRRVGVGVVRQGGLAWVTQIFYS
jgi:uncharacterized protein YkwD